MRTRNKRLCGLLLAVAMMLSLCCPALAAETDFPDTEGHWAEAVIHTLAADGIIHGYEDGRCCPDAPITRGQFAALVARVMELTAENENNSAFADLTEHWSADYVLALVKAGIIQPSDYGTAYEPDKEITRMEMTVMTVRAIGKEPEAAKKQGQTKFTDDAEITATDSGYINIAAEYGIVVGYPNGAVRPYQGASRAEGFCMLMRMIDAYKKLQESLEDKGDGKTRNPYSSTGEKWSEPDPQISFTMPETAYTGAEVKVTASVRYASSVEWTLSENEVSKTPEGFSAEGGTLTFAEAGTYTLKAVATNSRGKSVEHEQTIIVYPVVGVAFTLPETVYTNTEIYVDLMLENAGEYDTVWSVKRDGETVKLSEAVIGIWNNMGGVFQFTQPGEYEMTASIEDAYGKTFSCSQKVIVLLPPNYAISIPESCHIGTPFTVSANGENINGCSVSWLLTNADNEVSYNGLLDINGGEISVNSTGKYILTATLTDLCGNTITAQDEICITNSPPTIPRVHTSIEYGWAKDPYTADCKVPVYMSISDGADPDGDEVTYEYAEDSAKTGYYGLGRYPIKVRAVDEWGEASEWSSYHLDIVDKKIEMKLNSVDLSKDMNSSGSELSITANITTNSLYRLSAIDYYDPENELEIIPDRSGKVIKGQFTPGDHLIVVQAKNLFGKTVYSSCFFMVNDFTDDEMENSGSSTTIIEENGIYNGSIPLAYIEHFTLDISAINGHNSNCTDTVSVYGFTENDVREKVLTFNTNNGYAHIDSDGNYEYAADDNTVSTSNRFIWNGERYTKLIFIYEMAEDHMCCSNIAPNVLSYTVDYKFMGDGSEKMDKLFE